MEIEQDVAEILSWCLPAFQRSVAIREGVRECMELWGSCDHTGWCHSRNICVDCGMTRMDMRLEANRSDENGELR